MGRRVLTIGTFDLFHVGHVELLRECRDLGWLTVGVNSDDFVTRYKGRPPVVGAEDRRIVVEACRYVDATFIHYGREFAKRDIEVNGASIIAVGDDWQGRDYLGQLGVTQDWLDRRGISVVYIPRTTGVSSSDVRSRLVTDAPPRAVVGVRPQDRLDHHAPDDGVCHRCVG